MANGEASQQVTASSEARYELLSRIIGELRNNAAMPSEIERKRHLQQLLAGLESELRGVARSLNKEDANLPGELYHVPNLIKGFKPEPRLHKQIKDRLLEKQTGEIARNHVLIEGQNGSGKSMMAVSLVRDEAVRAAFPNGIYWIALGPEPDIPDLQAALLRMMGQSECQFPDAEAAASRLQELCRERACLFVLDDVWDIQDVLAFNPGGLKSQLLLSTSHPDLLDFVKYALPTAKGFKIPPLSAQEAADLFMQCAGKGADVDPPAEVHNILEKCENNPLAIRLMGSAASTIPMPSWGSLLESFDFAEMDFPEGYPEYLMRALQVNLDNLGEEADYYSSLAVFFGHAFIPQAAVVTFWNYMYKIQEKQAYALLDDFAARGLFNISGEVPLGGIHLHAFQIEFLHMDADDKLHQHLLSAYRRQVKVGWPGGPNDGYYFQNLCKHLHSAKRGSELKSLLLDFEWLQKRIQVSTIHSLLRDYDDIKDADLNQLKNAMLNQDGDPIVIQNPEQLANVLFEALWQSDSKEIQSMLNQAKEVVPDWQPPYPDE